MINKLVECVRTVKNSSMRIKHSIIDLSGMMLLINIVIGGFIFIMLTKTIFQASLYSTYEGVGSTDDLFLLVYVPYIVPAIVILMISSIILVGIIWFYQAPKE